MGLGGSQAGGSSCGSELAWIEIESVGESVSDGSARVHRPIIERLKTEGVLELYYDIRARAISDSVIQDFSGNDEDGALVDVTLVDDGGDFDTGDSVVELSSPGSGLDPSEITIAAFGDFQSQSTKEVLISKGESTLRYALEIHATTLKFVTQGPTASIAANIVGKSYIAASTVNGDAVTHPSFYLDDIFLGLGDDESGWNSNSDSLYCGNDDAGDNQVDSTVAAFLVLSRELTADEHYELYRELEHRVFAPGLGESISSSDAIVSIQRNVTALGESISSSDSTVAVQRNVEASGESISDSIAALRTYGFISATLESVSSGSSALLSSGFISAVGESISSSGFALNVLAQISAILESTSDSNITLTSLVSKIAAIGESVSSSELYLSRPVDLGAAIGESVSSGSNYLINYPPPRDEIEAVNSNNPNLEFAIKRHDTDPSIRMQMVWTYNNTPYDLTDALVTFYLYSVSDTTGETTQLVGAPAVVEWPPTNGIVRYDWSVGDTDVAGYHIAEFQMTKRNRQYTKPESGYMIVRINKDLNDA